MAPKAKAFLLAAAVVFPLDQLTKWWVSAALHYGERVPVIPGFFSITHVRNPGAAFSLFAESPEPFRRVFFIGVTLVAIALIVSFYRRLAPRERLPALALGLVLGGALGNLVDRIFRAGEVVDFLHFRLWADYTWPDFNVADSAIVVGVLLLILELLASEGETRAESPKADPRGSDAGPA